MSLIKNSNILRSLKVVWESSIKWSLVNGFFVLLKGLLPLLIIFLIQLLVDKVSEVILMKGKEGDIKQVYGVLIFAGLVFVINAIINSLSSIVREKHSFYINDIVQNLIHHRTTGLYYANFDDFNFQNIYYRAINEAGYRPARIYYGFISLLQNSITLILIGGLLVSLHWGVTLLLVVIGIPIVYTRLHYSKKAYKLKREQTEKERLVNYHNRLLTGKEFAKELRIFGLQALFKSRYENLKGILRETQFRLLKAKTTYEFVIQVITVFVLFGVFGYITTSALRGDVTPGQMVMYFLALYRGYSFLNELLGRITGLYEDGLFLKNFFEFVDFGSVDQSETRTVDFPEAIKNSISISNMSFKYPNSVRNVFEDLSLTIFPGETVAIVGANGAGKSTLVKLLCGLYIPDKGSIKIDDVDLASIKRESISSNVSVVFQDFMLYNVSARENIWFGDITKSSEDNEIYKSAEKCGIDKIIGDLPQGYNTRLGTLFKDSEMLSAGEWQRMALSRSFFNDAQIVILDEPTSSLDAFTEANLINHFKAIAKGRTAIIVSHRLSTISWVDRVVVVGHHGILEEGNPKELLKKNGVFAEMVEAVRKTGYLETGIN
jgi:ATP-binding cassette subfamily B protein